MDYTLSPNFVTHGGTGNRMHEADQPLPTVVGERDMNSVIWSLMEVVKAAGLTGIQFDPAVPASYQRLLLALNTLFITPAELTAAIDAAGTGRPGHAYGFADWFWVDKPRGLFVQYAKVSIPGTGGVVWTYPVSFTTAVLAAWGTPAYMVSQPVVFNGLPGLSSASVDYRDTTEVGDAWVFALGV